MKVAVVHSRDSKEAVHLSGMPNTEKIGLKTIRRIADAPKQGGLVGVADPRRGGSAGGPAS